MTNEREILIAKLAKVFDEHRQSDDREVKAACGVIALINGTLCGPDNATSRLFLFTDPFARSMHNALNSMQN